MLRLKAKHLPSHTAIFGDTGGGKTLFMLDYLREVERRGEIAIIWDPDRQFASKFRNVNRGDWILDPTCSEVPYWDIRREYRDEGEAHALSTCFFPDNPTVKDPFWNTSARGLFTALNAMHHPTTAELTLWMAQDDPLIDERVAGTEYARILTNNAPGMRSSIIAHLNQIAQPLRMMPTHPDGHRTFSVRDWCENRNSWIFITSSPSYSAILNPLHTFFVSSLVQRMISMGQRKDLPKVHFIFEEASSITIQEFHLALIRLRKTGNPVVYAIQNFSDLRAAYGDKAETIYSQAFHKVFFRLGSNDSAKKASETIGQKQVLKMRENYQAPSWGLGQHSRNFTVQKEIEPVVPDYVLQNLPDRTGYIISPGKIAKFRLPIITMPDRQPRLTERLIPPMIRRLSQPLLAPEPPVAQPIQQPIALLGQNHF